MFKRLLNRQRADAGVPVGVLIVHGIGTREVGYSEHFRKKLKKVLKQRFGLSEAHCVCYEEVFWAANTKSLQSEYQLNNLVYRPELERVRLRKFVVESLADAASYQNLKPDASDPERESTYERITADIRTSMANLAAKVDAVNSPLVVVAHSFGGWVMSCYIDDVQKAVRRAREQDPNANLDFLRRHNSPFERFDTLGGVVTIGCNIPAFVFCIEPKSVRPVHVPGPRYERNPRPNKNGAEQKAWLNFYSPWDALGYPLQTINKDYNQTVEDIVVNIAPKISKGWWWFDFETPHLGYWGNKEVLHESAGLIRDLYKQADVLTLNAKDELSNDPGQPAARTNVETFPLRQGAE